MCSRVCRRTPIISLRSSRTHGITDLPQRSQRAHARRYRRVAVSGRCGRNAVARTDVDFVIARVAPRLHCGRGSMTTRSLTSMPTARRERPSGGRLLLLAGCERGRGAGGGLSRSMTSCADTTLLLLCRLRLGGHRQERGAHLRCIETGVLCAAANAFARSSSRTRAADLDDLTSPTTRVISWHDQRGHGLPAVVRAL